MERERNVPPLLCAWGITYNGREDPRLFFFGGIEVINREEEFDRARLRLPIVYYQTTYRAYDINKPVDMRSSYMSFSLFSLQHRPPSPVLTNIPRIALPAFGGGPGPCCTAPTDVAGYRCPMIGRA